MTGGGGCCLENDWIKEGEAHNWITGRIRNLERISLTNQAIKREGDLYSQTCKRLLLQPYNKVELLRLSCFLPGLLGRLTLPTYLLIVFMIAFGAQSWFHLLKFQASDCLYLYIQYLKTNSPAFSHSICESRLVTGLDNCTHFQQYNTYFYFIYLPNLGTALLTHRMTLGSLLLKA